MDLAEQVVDDAGSIDGKRIWQRLRELGSVRRPEIRGVVLAAAARCFFSKTLDALDVRPDARLPRARPCAARGAGRGPADRGLLTARGTQ